MNNVIMKAGDLEVTVDRESIGGFRGKCGALEISCYRCSYRKTFNDWTDEDLSNLGSTVQLIIQFLQRKGVDNVLIFAKQENNQFKFSVVPYPKCNFIEKIQGAIRAIFGGKAISDKQVKVIKEFYEDLNEKSEIPYPTPNPTEANKDAFCNQEIIKKQLVANAQLDGSNYHVLHDIRPKGGIDKPHLLIVPQGVDGHKKAAPDLVSQRTHIFMLARAAFQFLSEKYQSFHYIEREGSKLRGVNHTHANIHAMEAAPTTFFQKIALLFRSWLPLKLSDEALKEKITSLQGYNWSLV